jgi:hypothetical protein
MILDTVTGRAHIEYSPSGKGIRAICRGTLPPGRRQYDEPGHTHVGFGLYDGNRYLTITGAVLPESGPIEDLTAELAKLHAELFPPAAPPVNGHARAYSHKTHAVSLADDELLEKARRQNDGGLFIHLWNGDITDYASHSEADEALCFKLAFWTGPDAGRIDALFRQSALYRDKWEREDYRVRTMAAAIELTNKTYDQGRAHTRGPERNYRVNSVYGVAPTDEEAHSSGVEAAGDTGAQANESPHSAGVNWPEPPKEEAFYGLAGECVRMVEPHTEADPAALLIQLLVAFGSLVGRGPYYLVEAIRHFCNLFAVIVGQTSKSRKGTSLGQVQALFGQVDSEWCAGRVMGGLSSGEGLIWAVRDEIRDLAPIKERGRVVGHEEQVTDVGVKDKRLLVTEPEFASVLQRAERETNTLSAIIRQAWDNGNLRVLTKKQAATATDAHVALIGHITRDELRRCLNKTEAANGFANRFLWVCSKRSKCLPDGGKPDQVDFSDVIRRLKTAVGFARTVGRMERDSAARDIWHRVYQQLSDGQPGLFGEVTSRAEAQVLRLSCLYALLGCSAVVRAEHLIAALAMWEYCEASARFIFGDALGDATADELLRALLVRPDGMTRDDIREHFGRNKLSGEIDRALSVLQEYGRARMVRETTKQGRPPERWFAV